MTRAVSPVAALILLTGCSGPYSTLDPQGASAASIAGLWWAMLIGSAVIFALMMGLFALVIRRPELAARITPRRWIVWGGLVLPGIVLPPLVAWSLVAGERILPIPGQSVPRIEVEAVQWGWTFRYPDHGGGETYDRVILPLGEPVDLHITARDVVHAFWIPQLGGKIDAVPGKVNVLRLRADAPGEYGGLCAEFCGLDHTSMRFDALVVPPDEVADLVAGGAADE